MQARRCRPARRSSSEWNSTASSTRSAAIKAAASVGPPSTISRVMPRAARSSSTVREIEAAVASRRPQDLDAERQQSVLGGLRSAPGRRATQTGVSRALCTRRESTGRRSVLSSTTRTGESLGHAGQAAGQHRIVGQRRADADHDGIALRAKEMHALAHRLAGDRDRLAAGRAGFAVGRDRELEHDMGPAVAHAPDMAGMIAPRFLGAEADLDRNARGAQPRMALRPRLRDWDLRAPIRRAQCRRR